MRQSKMPMEKSNNPKRKKGNRKTTSFKVIYDLDKLDKATKEYICGLFLDQMVKVALEKLDNQE